MNNRSSNPPPQAPADNCWLALIVGNSRLHWGWWEGSTLHASWDTPHLSAPLAQQLIDAQFAGHVWYNVGAPMAPVPVLAKPPALWIASVVPDQLKFWQTYPGTRVITLDRLPLLGVYPTLGIDRALAVVGAGQTLGFPVLVIDAGTALTFTAADGNGQLVGGAILPGLGLQLQSLDERTAALRAVELPNQLPLRWGMDTPTAIQSGVIYSILAGVRDFMEDWWQRFPGAPVAIAGGDGALLLTYLLALAPAVAALAIASPHLIFWGMRSVVMANG